MATAANQLLNTTELNKKLGGSGTGDEILDADEIISGWGNGVYIVGSLTGHVIPDNGEVWPVRTYSFGNSKEAAVNGQSVTVNVRNTNWTSTSDYSINTSYTYFYDGDDPASLGYYMIVSGNPPYQYYQVTNTNGKISGGTYTPHYFNWDSSLTTQDGYLIVDVPFDNANHRFDFSTNGTPQTSSTYKSAYRFQIDGSDPINSLSDSKITVTVSTSKYLTLKRSAANQDDTHPLTLIKIADKYDNIYYYHGVLATYWHLTANDMSVSDSYTGTQSASVSTNMGGYTLSKPGSETWFDIYNNQVRILTGNGTYDNNTATINVSSQVSTIINENGSIYNDLDEFEYTSPTLTTSFTLTQQGKVRPTLYVLWIRDDGNNNTTIIDKFYLIGCQPADLNGITSSNYTQYLISAPGSIKINPPSGEDYINIRTGLTPLQQPSSSTYVQYSMSSGQINANNNTAFLRWVQQTETGTNNKIYHENGNTVYGSISLQDSPAAVFFGGDPVVGWASTAPSNWTLSSTLVIR